MAVKDLAEAYSGQLHIYPNPPRDILWLYLPDRDISRWTARLWDMQGRVHQPRSIPASNGELGLDVAMLPSGLYVVRIRDKKGVSYSTKFIR